MGAASHTASHTGGQTAGHTASRAAAAEILRNALSVAAEEASIVVVRSACSTFIVEGADASAAILDADGQLVAESLATSLAHGSSLRCSLRSILEDHPPETMRPGDAYAMNDVYRGGIHANDLVVVRPVFGDGRVRYFTGTLIHIADLGGDAAGGVNPGALEIYSEGLQLPPVRLATADGFDDAICRILALNSRMPDSTLGDVRALVAGCNVAARRMDALVAQHGPDSLDEQVADHLRYTETRVRRAIAALPDGSYHGSFTVDDDGIRPGSHTVRVRVAIDGDAMVVDYDGTDPQVASSINCGYSQTLSATLFAVRCFLDPEIPMNEGCFRPLDIRMPRGSLVNPEPPHPAGGRNFVMCAAIDAVIQALSDAVPDSAVAASAIIQPICIASADAARRPWIHMSFEYGGVGGRRHRDGPDATGVHFGLSRNTVPQVEPVEATTPLLVESKELVPDSGGPGRWRGGLASRTVFRVLEDALVTVRGDRLAQPPPGREGGRPGHGGGYFRRDVDGRVTRLPSKQARLPFRAGEALIVETSGGGGLGPSEERDPEAVRRDVATGRVTAAAAERDYGVAAT